MIQSSYRYKALVYRAVDGDTFDALLRTADHGLYRWDMTPCRLRLLDIDTWERRGDQKHMGDAATEYAWSLFQGYCRLNWCYVVTEKDKKGKYGRFLARMYLPLPAKWEGPIILNPVTHEDGIQLAVALEMQGFKKEKGNE